MKKLLFLFAGIVSSGIYAQCVSINGCPVNITTNADSTTCTAVVNFTPPTSVYNCSLTPTTITYNYTGSLQTFTVPAGITSIHVDATGAQGGSINVSCTATGGLGAQMTGDIAVTPGEIISILVGQQGFTNGADAGGGGGSFVVRAGNIPLVVAGGGGGASNNIGSCGSNLNGINATITTDGTASGNGLVPGGTGGNGGGASTGSGGGGGGFYTNGTAGTGLANNNGKSYINGGAGGTGNNNDFGGYGGGGAGWFTGGNGGGGGGYSGGGTSGSQPFTGGGGGGSYNIGTNQVNTAGVQTGNGRVIISYLPDTTTYVNMVAGLASGSQFPIGVTNQMYVATDSAGNYDTCTFTVTVLDIHDPAISSMSNITVDADSATCGAIVTFANPTTNDCSSTSVLQTSGLPSGSSFPIGTTNVIFTATDAAGNSSTAGFQVIVSDITPPVPDPVLSLSVSADSATCSAVVNFANPTFTDCSSYTVLQTSGLPSGSTFPVGATNNVFTATDAAGNTATISLSVIVNDVTDPVISCAGDVISCTQIVSGISATASDICAGAVTVDYALTGATIGAGSGSASGTSFNVGVTTVTYTASDAAGNTASCSLDVTIIDCSGIEDNDPLSLIQLYPNPNSGFVNVNLGATYENINIQIANISGQVISTRQYTNTESVNISTIDLSAGMYIMYITADGVSKTVRMIRN